MTRLPICETSTSLDPHAGAGDLGQRYLHLGVIVLAEGGADRRGGVAGGFGQLADVAGGENEVACAHADQRIDAGQRLVGAHGGGRVHAGQRTAALIVGAGVIAADADLNQVGGRDFLARRDKPLPFLREAGNARADDIGRSCCRAADGKVVLRNSEQR